MDTGKPKNSEMATDGHPAEAAMADMSKLSNAAWAWTEGIPQPGAGGVPTIQV